MTTMLALALGGMGRDVLKMVSVLVVAMVIALAFAISSVLTLIGAALPGIGVGSAQESAIPADQRAVMETAAQLCGLPWQVLAAVAKTESDFGRNMATSSAGAIGYGQFMPATWAQVGPQGQQGNPYDFHDALPAMARYLCASGGPQDLRHALFAYNHADWYVDQVLAVAVRYGYLASGAPSSQVVDLARAQLGMPYVWGGANPQTSFDCSGLVQWVYGQTGTHLPRTAQEQFDATARVPNDQLAPGDLLFFAHTYPSAPSEPITHVGIYIGNGEMINAPSTGDVVRVLPAFDGYWASHYAGAGRVGR